MTYSFALLIARIAHENQVDKGGNPYINHPLYIASKFENKDLKIAAILHDVMEDSKGTLDTYKNIIERNILEALYAITKQDNETYNEYIKRVKLNDLARQVKIEDLKHNMDLSRIKNPQQKDYDRIEKYKTALKYLEDASE